MNPADINQVLQLLDRFVTAVGAMEYSLNSMAESFRRQAEYAEEGLELSRKHVAAQAQMIETSKSLEKSLEDRLVDDFTPKSGGRA